MGMGGIAINNSEKLLKNKKKLSGKTSILSGKCQGILNGLQCGNPEELDILLGQTYL